MEKIAIIGSGLIGRAWAMVFARAGHPVRLFDAAPEAAQQALALIRAGLEELREFGLIAESAETVAKRVSATATLADALKDADYVQENTAENLDVKRTVYRQMDDLAPAHCILASSTSTIQTSRFSEGLKGKQRCIVAHPGTPPHLLKLVEIVPAPWTSAETVERTRKLMEDCGQIPTVLRKEIQGFILNRLQYAVIAEAYRLWEDGVASIDDIDKTVRDALGLRWSFMGPIETISLNAPGGVPDYDERYGEIVHQVNASQRARPWDKEAVKRLEAERLRSRPIKDIASRRTWRDRRLMALLAHRRQMATNEGD